MFKKLSAKILALLLCATMVMGAGVGMLDFGAGVSAPETSGGGRSDLENVTGQYSLDAIKESQYDKSLVSEKPEYLTGKGSVIVKIEGDDLYNYYEKNGAKTEFSDFVSSPAGKRYTDGLKDKQHRVLAAMKKRGIAYELRYSYTAVTNAFSVEVDYSDVENIRAINGVESVYYGNTYAQPEYTVSENNANVYSTGIYDSSEVGYDGAGTVVAVLDTGLDYTHKAFSHMPKNTADIWDKDYVEKQFGGTLAKTERMPSATVDDVYVNAKVPYAFDYADNDCNVYPSYSTHGTHVAGIIAGRDEDKIVGTDEETGEEETFVGVAPEAQLVIMKVFTDDLDSKLLGGADTDDILAAVHDCAVLGVDVINMSLGSSGGFSSESTNEFLSFVYDKVEKLGISLIVAAGNESSSGYGGGNGMNLASNPDSGTVGSPSTYGHALSVASINGQKSPYFIANEADNGGTPAFVTNAADMNSNDVKFVEELFEKYEEENPSMIDADGSLRLNYVVVGGVGRTNNYTPIITRELNKGNTIALVRRGDISFSEKVQNAMSRGAVGVIVYNNLSGEIRMSLAEVEDPVPTCSISLNEGTAMVNGATMSKGTITLNKKYTAGPFMSSFSGLGVTPDLKLKPEITAHGGEILSAVPGGYDKYSGTSMASPNMAGAVALLRQHVREEGLTGVALNARINQLLMSSATIALNPDGNPYSPRKQGAGLANILAAVNTQAYIAVPDGNGGYLDKTKIEFGDDVKKGGVYTAKFSVVNQTAAEMRYTFSSYVFTETLAINKKTVEENAYMLDDALVTFDANGVSGGEGDTITVPAGGKTDLTVTVTLTERDRQYLDESFENGMYVEGYFRLLKEGDAYCDLSLPFLAFYGDWSAAPLFDYSIYDLAITDADPTIEDEDKPKASARETTPLGLFNDGKYIMPLGSYLYNQNEEDVEIFPSSDKASISMYDTEARRTVYQLYMIYGGLLRGAKTLHITITDAVTGEIVYDKTENNVRKAYANGGNNVGSPIMIEMNPYEWGLANNREYIFNMKGTLDWKDGNANNDEFEFNFHVDYEAPSIESYSVRFEPYMDNKETKYRIWLDVNVYDNRYVASLLPCYVKDNKLMLMTEYVIPVNSMANSLTKVSFEITDFYDDYYDEIYLGVEDYAMNQSLYRLNLTNATKYCDKLEYEQQDGKFVQTDTRTSTTIINGEQVKSEYGVYSLTLSPNEVYKMKAAVTPSDTFAYKLDWQTGNSSVAVASENEIFAKKAGSTVISVKDGNGLTKAQINVKVAGDEQKSPTPERLTFRPAVNKDNNIQSLEQNGTTIELYPNTRLELKVDAEPWYLTGGLKLNWSSSNPDVASVDENGVLTTKKKGIASITVSADGFERVSAMLRVSVVSEFRIVNYVLYEYHGSPDVVIHDDLNVMMIDEDCFSGNRSITSVTLPKTLTEVGENCFKNCTGLQTVTIPSETNVIGKSAFEGCVSLKKIVLKTFVDEEYDAEMTGAITVANRGFYNCISLQEITNPTRLTTVGREAFKGCKSLRTLDVTGLAVSYESAFENCTSLSELKLSAFTSPSVNMFKGCTALETVTYPMKSVSDGMFSGCVNLKTITFTQSLSYVGAEAFANTSLTSITIPGGDVRIGAYAFKNCAELTRFTVGSGARLNFVGIKPFDGCAKFTAFALDGNTDYFVDGGILYNAAKTQIVFVPEAVTSVTSLPSSVTEIGNNVFAGKTSLKSFNFAGITKIGDYAFAGSGLTSVALPSSVEFVGKGAFEGCAQLSSVDISGARTDSISDFLFKSCDSLKSVRLPVGVTSIGDGAFENTPIQSIDFNGAPIVSIGENAFMSTRLSKAELPSSVRKIGAGAFSRIPSLSSAVIPAITEMGRGAFEGCSVLSSVTIADGATVIGEDAFAWRPDGLNTATSPLKNVTIPDSVQTIGAGAFYNCSSLKEVNLKGVQTIGAAAFYASGIIGVDTSAASIGELAFCDCKSLTSAKINGAKYIGVGAFLGSALQTVEMNAVTAVGANAFTDTRLTTVTLPSSLSEYSREKTLTLYSQSSGKLEEKQVFEPSVGSGAFAGIPTLTQIAVADGNDVFFSENGVLYAKVANGYALVQYPSGKDGESYEIKSGTVRIEADAFNGVSVLKKVVLPADVTSIGARAFYKSSVNDYTFKSVRVPNLDSEYVDVTGVSTKDIMYTLFATTGNLQLGSQVFYANFYDYVAKRTEERKLNENGHNYKAPSFGLKITYPENGVGYDNLVWEGFFETRETSAYAADALTISVNNAIASMPASSAIEAVASLSALEELSRTVKEARRLYNTVTDAKQLELVDYDMLKNAESAVRAARSRLGAPAKVSSLKIAQMPNLRYYVGENFDKTGMKVIAVYDDTSEEEVTDYAVDKTLLTLDDDFVTVTYSGVSVGFAIAVEEPVYRTLTFTGEFVTEFTVQVLEGRKADIPADPKKSGYRFEGWTADGEWFDFDKPVTADITLTAVWSKGGSRIDFGVLSAILWGFCVGIPVLFAILYFSVVGVFKLVKRTVGKSADGQTEPEKNAETENSAEETEKTEETKSIEDKEDGSEKE
ncbi:MAG: leucine-rich repeat protein [Clostridia bacterium]|nr:leucine-rich repeat protein [Clostridia bacterium]